MKSKSSNKGWILLGIILTVIMFLCLMLAQKNVDNSEPLEHQFDKQYMTFKKNGYQEKDFKRAFKTAKKLHVKYHNSDELAKLDYARVNVNGKKRKAEIHQWSTQAKKDTYTLN